MVSNNVGIFPGTIPGEKRTGRESKVLAETVNQTNLAEREKIWQRENNNFYMRDMNTEC